MWGWFRGQDNSKSDQVRSKVFRSTKTYTHASGWGCVFRQWRAESHCRFPHGYALQFKLTFEGDLDENGWVVDFGGLKKVKEWLAEHFDHKWLVAEDDPYRKVFESLEAQGVAQIIIVPAVGMEAFASQVFDQVDWILHAIPITLHNVGGRVQLVEVEVSEHEGNSAICRRSQ